MQIVDAQIHTWGVGLPSNMSHRQITHYTPAEAIKEMDEGGIQAAVIHPPGWDPNSTQMAFDAVKSYPGRFAIMGSLPLEDPSSRAKIATWRAQPGMLGLRYTFLHDPARQQLADGAFDWLFAEAEKAGVPIATLATDSLGYLGKMAERHPGLKLTIDHLGGRGGLTTLKDDAAMTHIPELLKLAKLPNVAVKATGAPSPLTIRMRPVVVRARSIWPVASACAGTAPWVYQSETCGLNSLSLAKTIFIFSSVSG
jgi:predicted TIM-barrel fold metal-dependent hydrolase